MAESKYPKHGAKPYRRDYDEEDYSFLAELDPKTYFHGKSKRVAVQIRPVPRCPNCQAPMRLMVYEETDSNDEYAEWTCPRQSKCNGKRRVFGGVPESDEDIERMEW